MGRTKALLPIGARGQTFLTRIIDVLREGGASHAFVVIGTDAEAVMASLPAHDPFVTVVSNPDVDRGQLSSLLLGLDAVERVCPDRKSTRLNSSHT